MKFSWQSMKNGKRTKGGTLGATIIFRDRVANKEDREGTVGGGGRAQRDGSHRGQVTRWQSDH